MDCGLTYVRAPPRVCHRACSSGSRCRAFDGAASAAMDATRRMEGGEGHVIFYRLLATLPRACLIKRVFTCMCVCFCPVRRECKDATLERLRHQAIQQQEALIDQNRKLERFLHDEKQATRGIVVRSGFRLLGDTQAEDFCIPTCRYGRPA